MKPQYADMHDWEFYTSAILTEYQQSVDEGLDIETYKDVFKAVERPPKNEIKKKIGDVLFDVVINAKPKEGYKYIEPSDLDGIKALRREHHLADNSDKKCQKVKYKAHGWEEFAVKCLFLRCLQSQQLPIISRI